MLGEVSGGLHPCLALSWPMRECSPLHTSIKYLRSNCVLHPKRCLLHMCTGCAALLRCKILCNVCYPLAHMSQWVSWPDSTLWCRLCLSVTWIQCCAYSGACWMCRCPWVMLPRLRWMHLQQQGRKLLFQAHLHSSLMSCKWARIPQVGLFSEGPFGLPWPGKFHSCGNTRLARHPHYWFSSQLTHVYMSIQKFSYSF